ncbi:ParA family protein [Rickettsiales endosymbiont of Peranema trichophorum]|uniref:ParA family protein n=1 Tax=Rickettsiales endosymbiont of Peranema trichophorum TaxID=2486577 RepID=UPI00102394E8|nr:AAA family ATPase [Rickettsiales endosymbiont of Peranema trichophorum]RZI47183.1 ParA family protein [Rickettsiales endosymbiont of Peranema trichophorum]
MREAKVICVTNQKGGVGKTTTAINFATAISAVGKKTLLVDLDPQGNASSGLGISYDDRVTSIYEVLVNSYRIRDSVRQTQFGMLDIIPSSINLAAAEIELSSFQERESVLKEKIAELMKLYEFIIIDCPPSLGLLTINALVTSHSALIPLQCEFFALEGITHLLHTIHLVQKELNPTLHIEGILLTMLDRRNNLTSIVENDVRGMFKELVYQTTIPRNIKLSEAPSHGLPALLYDTKCLGSIAYIMLAKEVLEKYNQYGSKDE